MRAFGAVVIAAAVAIVSLRGRAGERPPAPPPARKPLAPHNLTALNTPADENEPYLARDGKHLLYTSNAARHFTLMISEQRKPVPFSDTVAYFVQVLEPCTMCTKHLLRFALTL